MNPRLSASYDELGRWLLGFARSHAKREDARVEALVDTAAGRQERSYGLRLLLGRRTHPAGEAAVELAYHEVAEGRTRLAWCAALAERIREGARQLAGQETGSRA